MKRHLLGDPNYTKKEVKKMCSLQVSYLNAMPGGNLPPQLELSEDKSTSTHHIEEIHTKKGTWVKSIAHGRILQTEVDAMIGYFTAYMTHRRNRIGWRSGNSNDPYNLVCYEFLLWLTGTLAVAECNENTLTMVTQRCNILENILVSGVFEPGKFNILTMRGTLTKVKNMLAGRVTLVIKREIANTHAREHLGKLQLYSKLIISGCIRFLYYIYNDTDRTPFPNIKRLRAREEDYANLVETKMGRLLRILLNTPDILSLFSEDHQNLDGLAVASYNTIITSEKSSSTSIKERQLIHNAFLRSNAPCIPLILTDNKKNVSISDFLNPKVLAEVKQVGIFSEIQKNPELLQLFVETFASTVELAKVFRACDDAKSLAVTGGDILVYCISNQSIIALMNTLISLCKKLLELLESTTTKCDIILEPIARAKKSTARENINWTENYKKISPIQQDLLTYINECIEQAEFVKERAGSITPDEWVKLGQKQTRYFAFVTNQLVGQVGQFMSRGNWKPAETKSQRNQPAKVPQESDKPSTIKNSKLALFFRKSRVNVRVLANMRQQISDAPADVSVPVPALTAGEKITRRRSNSQMRRDSISASKSAQEASGSPVVRSRAGTLTDDGHAPKAPDSLSLSPPTSSHRLSVFSRGRKGTVSGLIGTGTPTESPAASPSLGRAAVQKKRPAVVETVPVVEIIEPVKKPTYETIDLIGNAKSNEFIEDSSLWLLDEYLKTSPETTEIHLQNNKITSIGTIELCGLLSEHKILEKLNCSSNNKLFSWCTNEDLQLKGWAAVKAFSQLVGNHSCLKELNISDCGLTPEGAECLAEGLKKNHALEFLDLSNNPIGIEGFKVICQALHEHPRIQSLMVMGIKLDDSCGQAICELLEHNPRITLIGFSEVDNFTSKTSDKIFELLRSNRERSAAQMRK